LTWINRHGGCAAKRSNQKRSAEEFEDYGLADTDFPHHRQSPAMQNLTIPSTTPIMNNAVSPTIPRLNEQGTFYGGEQQQQHQQQQQDIYNSYAYQPQLDQPSSAGISDYNNSQPYYYQDPSNAVANTNVVMSGGAAAAGGGYYDEAGYYYDGNQQHQQQQYHLQQPYNDQLQHSATYSDHTNVGGEGGYYYKPDQVDIKPHQHM
jgi:hypothetical protein